MIRFINVVLFLLKDLAGFRSTLCAIQICLLTCLQFDEKFKNLKFGLLILPGI